MGKQVFAQPVVTGPRFLKLVDPMVNQLRKLFTEIEISALDVVASAQTVHELENGLVHLFDFSHSDLFTKGAEKDKKYAGSIRRVIAQNQKRIAASILESDKKRFDKAISKVKVKPGQTTVIAPDVTHALARSSSLIKSQHAGIRISATKKDEMRRIVRRAMKDNPLQTTAGTIRQDLTAKVRGDLKDYFKGFKKKTGPLGIPANLHTIAVTETRFLVNNVRQEYMEMAGDRLPEELEMTKMWRHNSSLSSNPRHNHEDADGQTVMLNEQFTLRGIDGGVFMCSCPHAPGLPRKETIGCNCEAVYGVRKVSVKK